jgi:hypothetical protein
MYDSRTRGDLIRTIIQCAYTVLADPMYCLSHGYGPMAVHVRSQMITAFELCNNKQYATDMFLAGLKGEHKGLC